MPSSSSRAVVPQVQLVQNSVPRTVIRLKHVVSGTMEGGA